jgi:uncharacterized protein (TIGR02147 family)
MKMANDLSLNIKNFGDYREFLKFHFEMKKNLNPNWSYGVWAKRLGLKATSSLTKILSGDRDPGPEITSKLVSFLNFDTIEEQYFCDLIRLSKIKDDTRLKMMLMEKMGREHPDAKLQVIDDRSFDIISNWFCLTIREMVKLQDFVEDAEWIQKRLMFEVPQEQISKAIQDLLHQGLLKRSKEGKLVTSTGLLHTTNDIASEVIKKYHEQMLDNAKSALRKVSVEEREFSSETFTIDANKLPEAKEFLREFKSKFVRIFEEQSGSETYQFQMQFFPLTHRSN